MSIRRIAIVGTGLIGSSWAAYFLAQGFDVTATDPAPGAEARMRNEIDRVWSDLEQTGLAPKASVERLTFHSNLDRALKNADFVQESGPERLELKRELYRSMDAVLPAEVAIASSSSALLMSDIQQACERFPERCVIAHPFNPPHLIPLVEIVGGHLTSADMLDQVQAFYEALGKKCIRLNKEIRGHIANRIAWALYKEAVWLVQNDYISVSDADRAVAWGPGLRWGAMGPNLLYHLGGGAGGIVHFFSQFEDTFKELWASNNVPHLTPELKQKILDGLNTEAGEYSVDELVRARDRFLIDLIAMRNQSGEVLAR